MAVRTALVGELYHGSMTPHKRREVRTYDLTMSSPCGLLAQTIGRLRLPKQRQIYSLWFTLLGFAPDLPATRLVPTSPQPFPLVPIGPLSSTHMSSHVSD